MPQVKRMRILAEILTAENALEAGFLLQINPGTGLDAVAAALCEPIAALVLVTQRVIEESL